MAFSFLSKKIQINFFGLIIFFSCLSCLSCQSLNQTGKSIKKSRQSKSVLIDKNYFENKAFLNYLKGETAFLESNSAVALKHFKKARAFAPQSIHLQKRIAEIYEKEGLLAFALNEYKDLAQKNSHKKKFVEKLSDLYALQQLNNQALKQNELLLEKQPYNWLFIFKKAILLINKENWTEALQALKTAQSEAVFLEEEIQSLLFLAYVLARQGKTEHSRETIRQIKHLDFPEEKLALKTADFYKSFDSKSAELYLEGFQKEKGATPAVSIALLNIALSSKNWEKAMLYIQQLEDLGYRNEELYFYSALFYIKEKQYNKASLYLKDLTNQKPYNGHYNYLLALSYEKSRQWRKAIKSYQKVPSHSPYFLTAHLQLAQLWQTQGEHKKSFELLDHLAFNNPASPQAVLLYAESLWKTGDKKQALNILSKALKYHPNHPDILFLRGFYFKQTGAIELALEDMNQILSVQSNHSEALKLIASLSPLK